MTTVQIDAELLDEVLDFVIRHRERTVLQRGKVARAGIALMDELIAKVNAILGEHSSTARRERLMRETYGP